MSPDVTTSEIRAVVEWLRSEIGVPFVVVGGSAIQIEVHVATKDVDILVSGRDLAKVDPPIFDPGGGPPKPRYRLDAPNRPGPRRRGLRNLIPLFVWREVRLRCERSSQSTCPPSRD
jgi:hypothetical protein